VRNMPPKEYFGTGKFKVYCEGQEIYTTIETAELPEIRSCDFCKYYRIVKLGYLFVAHYCGIKQKCLKYKTGNCKKFEKSERGENE